MGCCASKQQELYLDIPRNVSTTDTWTLRHKSFLDGCKLLPYTAACPASYPYQCLTRVVLGDGHLFAALWEGKGGSQAARHCVSMCYDMLLECLKTTDDPSVALQSTFQKLDESYLNSDLPDLVKASVGATGTILFLDTRTNRCHVARLGKAAPFATASKGSFNTATVEIRDLLPFSTNPRSRQTSSAGHSSSQPQPLDQPWDPLAAGVTHAVGLGCGKRDSLRKVWLQHQQKHAYAPGAVAEHRSKNRVPRISNDCEVYVSQLSTADENLVLSAEGLSQISPPKEIATLLQHFSAGTLNDTKRAFCAIKEQQLELLQQQQQQQGAAASRSISSRAAAGSRDGKRKAADVDAADMQPDPLVELSTPTNVASIVVHQALAKALDRFNRAMSRERQPVQQQDAKQQQQQHSMQPGAAYQLAEGPGELMYDELSALPLHVDLDVFSSDSGLGGPVRLPDSYPVGGLSKADVHGDMGIVVIALNWPRPPDALRGPALVTPLRPGPRALKRRPEAEWRWTLLRLHVKACQAYRRSLRQAWWQLVDDVQAAAEVAARQAEVQAWKTKGAAVKVNLSGAVVDPNTPVNFLRAHNTPQSHTRQPPRQAATAATAGRPVSSSGGGGGSGSHVQASVTALPSAGGAAASSLAGYRSSSSSVLADGLGTAVTAGPQQIHPGSLPDVAARSLRSTGGGVRGGVVAAAVAAINSKSPAPLDSPRSAVSASFRSSAGSMKGVVGMQAAAKGLTVQADMPPYNLPDTAQDLDSPTKALDSPNKFMPGSAGVTPTGPRLRGAAGSALDAAATAAAWGPSGITTPSRTASPAVSTGGAASVNGSYSSHKALSLRSSSRGPAAAMGKSTSPAAVTPEAARAGSGRVSTTGHGGYVGAVGGSGRRPTAGSAGGVARTAGGTPGAKRDYDLRSAARKPAARW